VFDLDEDAVARVVCFVTRKHSNVVARTFTTKWGQGTAPKQYSLHFDPTG
jgi:hypothetical protein